MVSSLGIPSTNVFVVLEFQLSYSSPTLARRYIIVVAYSLRIIMMAVRNKNLEFCWVVVLFFFCSATKKSLMLTVFKQKRKSSM